jgi:hypothetical protein
MASNFDLQQMDADLLIPDDTYNGLGMKKNKKHLYKLS